VQGVELQEQFEQQQGQGMWKLGPLEPSSSSSSNQTQQQQQQQEL
jgi:hypothetical protein